MRLGDVHAAITAALDGGPPYIPGETDVRDMGGAREGLPPGSITDSANDIGPGIAAVLSTSGSTGNPRRVLLSRRALVASASATHAWLGGPGHWVLALPADHVAGIQVIIRAHLGGMGITEFAGRFAPEEFARVAEHALAVAERTYVSLVPTQVHRIMQAADDGAPAALDALSRFAGVLVGGSAIRPDLLARARSAGVRAVVTYGMTETCGGCVYDGVPLDGVRLRTIEDGQNEQGRDERGRVAPSPAEQNPIGLGRIKQGRIEISGPMLADGYWPPGPEFHTDTDGTRWFTTSDLGTLTEASGEPSKKHQYLQVLGRADDVVITGGVNVFPAAVEAAITVAPVAQVCVVGVPDPEWGHALVAVVTVTADCDEDALLAAIRDQVTATLGRAAAPRRLLVVDQLPGRGPGKVDRRAVARLAVGHETH